MVFAGINNLVSSTQKLSFKYKYILGGAWIIQRYLSADDRWLTTPIEGRAERQDAAGRGVWNCYSEAESFIIDLKCSVIEYQNINDSASCKSDTGIL